MTKPNSERRDIQRFHLIFRNRLLLAAFATFAFLMSPAFAKPKPESVRVLYIVPSDRNVRDDYKTTIEDTVREVQLWYACNLNGQTFTLNDPIVEVIETDHEADWYDSDGSDTWHRALDEASDKFHAKINDTDYIWVIYIDAPGGSGAGLRSVCVLMENDLKDLSRKHNIGGSAHEIGHALGLPHPGDSFPDALMQTGYIKYPLCYLMQEDERTLLKSDFITDSVHLDPRKRQCFVYDGGYFRWTETWKYFEYQPRKNAVMNFALRREDDNFYYIEDSSRGIWVTLPKSGKGDNAFWSAGDKDYTKAMNILDD